jgi:hypothetical protein
MSFRQRSVPTLKVFFALSRGRRGTQRALNSVSCPLLYEGVSSTPSKAATLRLVTRVLGLPHELGRMGRTRVSLDVGVQVLEAFQEFLDVLILCLEGRSIQFHFQILQLIQGLKHVAVPQVLVIS